VKCVVLFEVRTEFLNNILTSFGFKRLIGLLEKYKHIAMATNHHGVGSKVHASKCSLYEIHLEQWIMTTTNYVMKKENVVLHRNKRHSLLNPSHVSEM
jgi:hypothetical protein